VSAPFELPSCAFLSRTGEAAMPNPIWRVINIITTYAGQLDRQQWVVISFLVLGLGLLTLRGFGSRSNY
jgi:hypothetical protein